MLFALRDACASVLAEAVNFLLRYYFPRALCVRERSNVISFHSEFPPFQMNANFVQSVYVFLHLFADFAATNE
jgi:hypothetical protein